MRPLKTKYPCKSCGQPAEVYSRRESDEVLCDRCRTRNRLIYRANYRLEQAMKCKQIMENESSVDGLDRWLGALAEAVESAQALVQAVKSARCGEGKRLIKIARSRVGWVKDVVEQLDEVIGDALDEAPGLEAIDGAGEGLAPTEPAARPALRLVGRGDAP